MRAEFNSFKLSMARTQTEKEYNCFCIQSIHGNHFSQGEVVIWDNYLRDYIRNEQGGVLIFPEFHHADNYLKEHMTELECETIER